MPLSEYYCQSCHRIVDKIRAMREASLPVPCPECDHDAPRIMSSFNAFTYRDGYPRRIPDKGTYWHLGKEVKNMISGPVRPNEHPEINKPEPAPKPLKGDLVEAYDRAAADRARAVQAERDRQAAIKAY